MFQFQTGIRHEIGVVDRKDPPENLICILVGSPLVLILFGHNLVRSSGLFLCSLLNTVKNAWRMLTGIMIMVGNVSSRGR